MMINELCNVLQQLQPNTTGISIDFTPISLSLNPHWQNKKPSFHFNTFYTHLKHSQIYAKLPTSLSFTDDLQRSEKINFNFKP